MKDVSATVIQEKVDVEVISRHEVLHRHPEI